MFVPYLFLCITVVSHLFQWRIWCRKDCEHQACHPVLCNNCSGWWQEGRGEGLGQNACKVTTIVKCTDIHKVKIEKYEQMLVILLHKGVAGGSDHCS
jgi:hypothetical protein